MAAIDADDEVVPGFNGYFEILIAEDLEAVEGPVSGVLGRAFGVETGYEAIEGSKHCTHGGKTGNIISQGAERCRVFEDKGGC